MKKHTSACLFFLSFLCWSCATYTKVSVPLDEATNKGKVRVKSTLGADAYFNNIESSDNQYIGVKGEKRTPLNEKEIAGIYPATGKVYKVWITLINPSVKVEGYLYEVKDATIVVSSTMAAMDQYSSQMVNNSELQVTNIDKIKIRRKGSIGKGYLIGTSIGIGTGIILGATSGDGFTTFAVAGMLGIVGSIVGTATGSISGTKTYIIKGNLDTYHLYAPKLKKSSIVQE